MAAQAQDVLTSTYYKDLNREELKAFKLVMLVNLAQLGTNAPTLNSEALLKLDQRHCTILQRSLQPQEKSQEVVSQQAAFRAICASWCRLARKKACKHAASQHCCIEKMDNAMLFADHVAAFEFYCQKPSRFKETDRDRQRRISKIQTWLRQTIHDVLSQVTAEAEGMALEICAAETTVEMLTKEEQSTCKQQLFNLVYTHATNHFQQRNYDSASRFFSAAHMYSEEGNKAKTARVLAVCNLGMKALDRALEYVDIATQTEPTSVFNAFLRLKVHLLQKDCRAAANQVQAMMKCEDFTHEILRVAAQEAMGAEQTVVAKQALLQLWDLVEKDSNGTFQPGDQAVIMSNLVKITQDDQSDVSLYMDELSAIYNQGADRLEEVGYDGFFGADTSGRAAALEWLAATAWNAAIQGGEAKLYRDTAVLLCSAGKFYAAHPTPETSTIQYQMMAFLMSASASLEGATKESEDTQVQMCYGLAQKMLLRYTGAAQALADRRQSLAEPPSKAEDKQHVYKLIMEFELAVHIKDVGCQHAVLQHCREAPNFSAESMLKLAYFSKAALNSNPDVTRQALQAALQLLLSKGHAVPHDQVAQTLRTLLELSPTDGDKIKLYQQAKELLAGLPGSAYPDRELQWLVSTCWNRGAHQAKFLRCKAAERYMRLALGLLEHCHSLSGRKQMMVDELNKVVQRRAGQAETGAPSTSSPKERKRKRSDEAEVTTSISLTAVKEAPE